MNFQEDLSNGAKIRPKSSLLFKKSALNCRPIATKLTSFLGNVRRLLCMNHEDDPFNGS
jgi:hypothetical protein